MTISDFDFVRQDQNDELKDDVYNFWDYLNILTFNPSIQETITRLLRNGSYDIDHIVSELENLARELNVYFPLEPVSTLAPPPMETEQRNF